MLMSARQYVSWLTQSVRWYIDVSLLCFSFFVEWSPVVMLRFGCDVGVDDSSVGCPDTIFLYVKKNVVRLTYADIGQKPQENIDLEIEPQ